MASKKRYSEEQKQEVNTLCGGLFNAAMGFGQTLGPLISAVLYDKFGFRWTQDVVALTCIVFAVAYFIFGRGGKSSGARSSSSKSQASTSSSLKDPLMPKEFDQDKQTEDEDEAEDHQANEDSDKNNKVVHKD